MIARGFFAIQFRSGRRKTGSACHYTVEEACSLCLGSVVLDALKPSLGMNWHAYRPCWSDGS